MKEKREDKREDKRREAPEKTFTGLEPSKHEKHRQQRDPGAMRKERPWRPGEPDPLDEYKNKGPA